ncbi:hypothetical protein HY626_00305 [Candidatus Uhrbacteria bacterium]|nr:hypothetical protein [Candidatus Uhrbacteria bacterium]
MTRVEKNAAMEQRLDDMQGEIVGEVKRRTRKSRPWFSCTLILLIALLGVSVWALWNLAATGFWRIPLFTTLAYDPPSPTREVTPGVPAQTIVEETFSTTLTRRLYEGGGTLTDRSMEVTLSEASLTASLRSFLEEADLEWIDVSHTQLVVDPKVGMELFVPFMDSELETAATLWFAIEVSEGHVVVTPKEVRVGSAKIPGFLIAAFLKPFLEAELAKLNGTMVGYATISTMEILPRELVIVGELAVKVEAL